RFLLVGGVHVLPFSANAWADEAAVGIIMNSFVVRRTNAENDVVGARRQLLRSNRQLDRNGDQLPGVGLDLAATAIDQAVQARSLDDQGLRRLCLVHQLERIDVLDHALLVLTVEHAVLQDVQFHQRALDDGVGEDAHHDQQHRGVADQARTCQLGLLSREIVFGGVADQPARVVHLVHDGVACVDAGGTADALDLQAVTDVDAGRADLNAHGAIDAVAETHGFVVGVLLARAALFAAARIVGDDQGVLVEHHALEAGVGAHVDTHLLAQEAGIAIGGEGEEADPEQRPAADLEGEQVRHQVADRGEVADEGNADAQGNPQPDGVLGQLASEFASAHWRLVELHALVAITFGDLFRPHEYPSENALWAGVAAPYASSENSDEEQAEGADDQHRGKQNEVLRPEGCAENVKLSFRKVPPDGLTTVPVEPGGTEVKYEEKGSA